jgi:hypothetical protein
MLCLSSQGAQVRGTRDKSTSRCYLKSITLSTDKKMG